MFCFNTKYRTIKAYYCTKNDEKVVLLVCENKQPARIATEHCGICSNRKNLCCIIPGGDLYIPVSQMELPEFDVCVLLSQKEVVSACVLMCTHAASGCTHTHTHTSPAQLTSLPSVENCDNWMCDFKNLLRLTQEVWEPKCLRGSGALSSLKWQRGVVSQYSAHHVDFI